MAVFLEFGEIPGFNASDDVSPSFFLSFPLRRSILTYIKIVEHIPTSLTHDLFLPFLSLFCFVCFPV